MAVSGAAGLGSIPSLPANGAKMFDKVEINKIIDFDDSAVGIIDCNHLEQCTRGTKTFWQSTAYGNFDGLFLTLDTSGHLQIKCSLHKLWRKWRVDGKLDNSRVFTISDAIQSVALLENLIQVSLADSEIAYFELGLNLHMSRDPSDFIDQVTGCQCEKGAKELYIDANFEKNRQKTSIKSKDMRKILKMYDKTFEAIDRGRDEVDPNVLRIETMYKRQRIPMRDFLDRQWIDKYANRFLNDWMQLRFERDLVVAKGMRASQIEKAREILKMGLTRYLETSRKAFLERRITKKQWETIRVFARAWPDIKDCFSLEPSALEREYTTMLQQNFNISYL